MAVLVLFAGFTPGVHFCAMSGVHPISNRPSIAYTWFNKILVTMTLYNPFKKAPIAAKTFTVEIPRDVAGEYELGWRYASGQGVARDLVLAYKWLTVAARHGHEPALELKNMIAERMTASEVSSAEDQVRGSRTSSTAIVC